MFSKKNDNKISMLEMNEQKPEAVTDNFHVKGGLNDPPLLVKDDNLNAYTYNNSYSSNRTKEANTTKK